MKAIETRYREYRFRSRLEARWAVFFDTLGLTWDYEPEGFELPSGRYLPDFFIRNLSCWVEIKPKEPSDREHALAGELADATGQSVFVFHNGLFVFSNSEYPDFPAAHANFPGGGGDWPYAWCECSSCGLLGLRFEGRSDRLPCKECYRCSRGFDCLEHKDDPRIPGKRCPLSVHGDRGHSYDSPRLLSAYQAACSARFEFGESGAPVSR